MKQTIFWILTPLLLLCKVVSSCFNNKISENEFKRLIKVVQLNDASDNEVLMAYDKIICCQVQGEMERARLMILEIEKKHPSKNPDVDIFSEETLAI